MDRYESLVRKHKDAVYRQMVRTCGNYDDAEDVLSESLLKAYKALDQLDDDEHFRAWLSTIARRVCVRLRKRALLSPVLSLANVPEPYEEAVEPEMDLDALRDHIHKAIDDLPEGYRQVYVRREIEGLSGEETARSLGISLAAMKTRLFRARAMVRQAMDDCVGCRPI